MCSVVKGILLGCTGSLRHLVPPLWPLSGWHEGRCSTSSVCAVNLQHHCWQVPELTSHQVKQSDGGFLDPRVPGQGQRQHRVPPSALDGSGQGRDAAATAVSVAGPEPGTEGEKGRWSYTGDGEVWGTTRERGM